jgi:hypothetical protein
MSEIGEFVAVVVMAVVWWMPTFMCLSDLQRRQGISRSTSLKWTALLCVPILGAVLYTRRGRIQLDAEEAAGLRQKKG